MSISIQIDGPLLGKWRKLLRKWGFKSLAKKVAQMESWHYRCRRMEKGGFARIADVNMHLFPFSVHIPALRDGVK